MATFTAGEVIEEVRRIIQDKAGGPVQRLSDEDLLGFVNQSLRRIAVLRPDIFAVLKNDHPVVAGSVQEIPAEGFRLIELYAYRPVMETTPEVVYGDAFPLTEADHGRYRGFFTGVHAGRRHRNQLSTINYPRNYFRDLRVYNQFFLDADVQPAPTETSGRRAGTPYVGDVLVLSYAKNPSKILRVDQNIVELESAFMPVVVDATVFVAASMDDESVNSRRAEFFYRSFTEMLGVNLDSRPLTDVPYGGLRGTAAQGQG